MSSAVLDDDKFYTKDGKQNKVIKAMIDRLTSPRDDTLNYEAPTDDENIITWSYDTFIFLIENGIWFFGFAIPIYLFAFTLGGF